MTETAPTATHGEGQDGGGEGTRRDFLYLAAGAVGGIGVASFAWPFVHSMNPSRDVLALSTTTVDISAIEVGQAITVEWQKKPVFIRRRTEAEITEARNVDVEQLPDQETDEERAARPEWLVIVGVCTHLGCIPLGNKSGDSKGEFGGWFCPCHGSHYDTSGRIRKGPAPANLPVPPLEFLDDNTIRIG